MEMQRYGVRHLVQYFHLAQTGCVRFGIRSGLLLFRANEREEYFFSVARKSAANAVICGRAISSHCGSLRRTASLSKLR